VAAKKTISQNLKALLFCLAFLARPIEHCGILSLHFAAALDCFFDASLVPELVQNDLLIRRTSLWIAG